MQCEQCGEMATKVDCNARKIAEIDRSEKCGIIYHFGFHDCPLKKASVRKISKGDIEGIFKQDNTKKPCIAGSGLVQQAILTDSTWENIGSLDKAIKEKFEDEEFDPTGIICDEASCNWQAMQEIFGRDLVERSKSCDFHYKQRINRTKGKITSGDDDKEIFKTWWNKRRAHWCYAFRPDHFAPGANLAEVTNARFFHRGSVNLSLIAAALDDVVDSLIFEKRYKKIGENIKVTGSGRTFFNIRETELKRISSPKSKTKYY
ncbi:unnamed protein product [Mytilus coruscus]|uniref:Uncharacterized protein n=1 Tax=Mytilus coruscus TaxID=42192 RepID=A0A6J8B5A7_MYTCO|nr:unnamed protein product [Mytilus coruscus]